LADAEKSPAKEIASFSTLRGPSPDVARSQALAWLKGAGKTDEATLKSFEVIWAQAERPLLDRVADTLALGDPQAAQLLQEARDPSAPAPTAVPALLKDTKQPVFYRANLALAYSKALSNRRVYEEALEGLKAVKPEQVVDPSVYFFHRAVAEHALLLKDDAGRSIVRLMDDVVDAPERYRMVGALMLFDMQTWQEKDLGWIARKMDNIERRLELARGGPQTQKIQKEVVLRLDELIKQLENQAKGASRSNGGQCPDGGQPGGQPGNTTQPRSPQTDSIGGATNTAGKIDEKELRKIADQWGKLPEKERAEAIQNLTRGMPARHREVIENYFRKLAQVQP
jgi:hypothetical protein